MDPFYSVNFPRSGYFTVLAIYHAGGTMKWHGMRDHTEPLDITAYLAWFWSMVSDPSTSNTPLNP